MGFFTKHLLSSGRAQRENFWHLLVYITGFVYSRGPERITPSSLKYGQIPLKKSKKKSRKSQIFK